GAPVQPTDRHIVARAAAVSADPAKGKARPGALPRARVGVGDVVRAALGAPGVAAAAAPPVERVTSAAALVVLVDAVAVEQACIAVGVPVVAADRLDVVAAGALGARLQVAAGKHEHQRDESNGPHGTLLGEANLARAPRPEAAKTLARANGLLPAQRAGAL